MRASQISDVLLQRREQNAEPLAAVVVALCPANHVLRVAVNHELKIGGGSLPGDGSVESVEVDDALARIRAGAWRASQWRRREQLSLADVEE
jgi:hypothetical protein